MVVIRWFIIFIVPQFVKFEIKFKFLNLNLILLNISLMGKHLQLTNFPQPYFFRFLEEQFSIFELCLMARH